MKDINGGGGARKHNRRHTATAEKEEVQSKDNEQQSTLQYGWTRQNVLKRVKGSKTKACVMIATT